MPERPAAEAFAVFMPSGRRGRFPLGTTVLDAARHLGVDLDSVCGGRGLCGRCQVELSAGHHAKIGIRSAAAHLSAFGDIERRYAERRGLKHGRRLGCSTRLIGDAVIDVPAESQVHRPIVRKSPDERAVDVDPIVHLHTVEVAPASLDDRTSDFRRLTEALAREWKIENVVSDLSVLHGLQKTLRQGEWRVTAAVREGRELIGLWPGFRDRAVGLAVDVGSTTIAAHLCDLGDGDVLASDGVMNPQIRYGEDLMSRVSHIMMHPESLADLTGIVRRAIQDLAERTTRSVGLAPDDILEITLVGNPIMHHLTLGIDPTELGGAPFALALDTGMSLRAADLGLALHPGARAYVLPCIAGHVGADAAGVVLAEAPHLSDDITLVVDVGTNAELVLGNRHRLLAASSPTGPAFEGAQIGSGQRAAPGAIERVRIDPKTLEPRFKVIGADKWSDETGFAEAVRTVGVTGICGSGIIEVMAEMFLVGILTADGTVDGAMRARSPRVVADGRTFAYRLTDGRPGIVITQQDVRAVQLAKAALHAGARLLMDRFGISQVDRIVLAGAFGSHIDPLHALVLGMIPDCEPSAVRSAGNAAGTGARIALVNKAARSDIEAVVRRIEKVETAVEPSFQAHFVDAMGIPHRTQVYERLSRVVPLPMTAATPEPRRRRSRRP